MPKGMDLALFVELFGITKYPDAELKRHLIAGWPLVGRPTTSHVFDKDPKLALHDAEKVVERSFGQVRESESSTCDEELWSQATEENEKGWLKGPWYSISEAQKHFEKCPL